MTAKRVFYLILFSILFVASCSPVPRPVEHSFTVQKHLQAARHWDVLAANFAQQVSVAMQLRAKKIRESVASGIVPPLYIQTNDISDFGRSFRTYLITRLSELGYRISYSPENSLVVRWSVKKLYYNKDRTASGFPAQNTLAVAIGGGVYQIFDKNGYIFPGLLAAGVTADLLNQANGFVLPEKVPHTEIILTFTLSKGTRIFSRHSQAYYVNEKDFNHYSSIPDYAGEINSLKPVQFNVTNQ